MNELLMDHIIISQELHLMHTHTHSHTAKVAVYE